MNIEIYSNDFFKIREDKTKKIFIIELPIGNKVLMDSLVRTKIIQGATATDDYREIKFKAQSVKSLHQFKEDHNKLTGVKSLPINLAGEMLFNLTRQLDYLISHEYHTILGYTPENIIVINDKKFAFLGSEYVTEIEEEMTQISFPFSKNDFYVSPELLNITELPSQIHFKTAYFSLACLLMYALLSNDEFYKDYLRDKKPEKILEHLNNHPIKQTKMYWLLSRCLVEDPKRRSIILI
jgi:hypothetical protein